MRIGIISAMKEEIDSILSELLIESTIDKGMRTYYKGKLFGKQVVLVFSRWGKVAAATSITQMINDFSVEQIVFTGVAGSINTEVNIGDIVIGQELVQHDMDASPILPPFEIPLLQKKSFQTDKGLMKLMEKAAHNFLAEKEKFLTNQELKQFEISAPKIHLGHIASGDQFISTSAQFDRIKKLLPNVLCVEMEGAAVAQVCYEYQVPFSIIRTISDNSNNNAHVDFPLFAKEIASKYALGILKGYFKLLT